MIHNHPAWMRGLLGEAKMRRSFLPWMLLLASAPAGGAAAAAPKAARGMVVPFIQDDYARAVSEAKAKKRPLFIEAWAPW